MQEVCVCGNEWYFIINTSIVVVVNFDSCFILILLVMLCCLCNLLSQDHNIYSVSPPLKIGMPNSMDIGTVKTYSFGLFMFFNLGLIEIWNLSVAGKNINSLDVKLQGRLASFRKNSKCGNYVIHILDPVHINPYSILKPATWN